MPPLPPMPLELDAAVMPPLPAPSPPAPPVLPEDDEVAPDEPLLGPLSQPDVPTTAMTTIGQENVRNRRKDE